MNETNSITSTNVVGNVVDSIKDSDSLLEVGPTLTHLRLGSLHHLRHQSADLHLRQTDYQQPLRPDDRGKPVAAAFAAADQHDPFPDLSGRSRLSTATGLQLQPHRTAHAVDLSWLTIRPLADSQKIRTSKGSRRHLVVYRVSHLAIAYICSPCCFSACSQG